MKMTAKEVLENLISTIEKNSTDNKATITNVDLWVKSWREELSKVNNGVLDDVINWRFWDDNKNNRIIGFIIGTTLGIIIGACL